MNDGLAGEDIARLAKEYSDLRPVIEQIEEYLRVLRDIEEAQAMLMTRICAPLPKRSFRYLGQVCPKLKRIFRRPAA